MSSSTNLGRSERAAHSAERSRTCCSEGTSPVRRSQKRPARLSCQLKNSRIDITLCSYLTLRKGLLATGSLGEKLLALGDGLATEADTLLSVEDGTLPYEGLDATGTTVDLVESDLVDDLGAMLPGRGGKGM